MRGWDEWEKDTLLAAGYTGDKPSDPQELSLCNDIFARAIIKRVGDEAKDTRPILRNEPITTDKYGWIINPRPDNG